jgi:AraC-like DNA-binding protein
MMLQVAEPLSGLMQLDAMLGHGSITLFALSTALAVRDVRKMLQGKLLIALLVSLTFLTIAALPSARTIPLPTMLFARAVGLANLGLLWWFCLSLLRDDFRLGVFELGGFVALMVVPTIYLLEDLGIKVPFGATVNSIGDLPPITMVGHVIWVALSGRNSDLVESRRRARLWLSLVPLAALLVSLATESIESEPLASILRNGVGIMPALLVLLFWLTKMAPEQLQFKAHTTTGPQSPCIDPRDAALHRRLTKAMLEEQVYLRHGLTIEELAGMLVTPTHQLRHLINAGMGFRNFTAFINGYRLRHAKSALANDEHARATILAIAYESGFASLQSFNRVFKNSESQTPSEFRAAALTPPAQD